MSDTCYSDDEILVGDAAVLFNSPPDDAIGSALKVDKPQVGEPGRKNREYSDSIDSVPKIDKRQITQLGSKIGKYREFPSQSTDTKHEDRTYMDSGFTEDSLDSAFGSITTSLQAVQLEETTEKPSLQKQIDVLERRCQSTLDAQWRKFQQHAAALFLFARTGDVRTLLAELWSLFSIQNDDGDTPLHTAIISGQQDVALNFLMTVTQVGCKEDSIDIKNNRGQTPLMLAAVTGAAKLLKSLLTVGADPTLTDNKGNTVTHLATKFWKGGHCLKTLLESDRTGVKTTLKKHNFEGLTPCHLAVQSGKVACLQQLLMTDPSIVQVAESRTGFSPLHVAVQLESLPMAGQLLLQNEETVDSASFSGYTPLHLATLQRNYVLVAFLISSGADPTLRTYTDSSDQGESAFDMAGSDEQMQAALLGSCGSSESDVKTSPAAHLSAQPSGNLHKLPHSTRHRIASVLDRNETLRRQLCQSLRLGALFKTLELAESPSSSLLESYEAIGGTLKSLYVSLIQLGLLSVAEEVKTYMDPVPDRKDCDKEEEDSAYFSNSVHSCDPIK